MPEGRRGSYWLETAPRRHYPPLPGEIDCDVAVVGGGIAGLTVAWLLKQEGRRVVVLEAGRVLEGVTGRTTAKVSALHGLVYSRLTASFGEEAARAYGRANLEAIERIAEIVVSRGIDCGFERKAAYVFSGSGDQLNAVKAEVDAALKLGLPASFVREAPLPIRNQGAVRFDNQAQFHPVRYLAALAEAFHGDGCAIYEQTRVLDVEDGAPVKVTTELATITAREAIVATNLPILDRGGFFAKAYPKMHTVLAARIDEAGAPDGMFLGIDDPEASVRTHRDENGTVLICDGRAFGTGHEADVEGAYRELEALVSRYFPVREIEWRWANEDYVTMDGAPYVGRLTPGSRHVHVVTGFNHWGMTTSVVAGEVLRDEILGRPNPCAQLFQATRVKPGVSAPAFLKENLDVAKHWLEGRLGAAARFPEDLRPGEGAVMKLGGERYAVSRDEDGRLHAVSPICTHLGCAVAWNNLDRTWDCPCHGSRFGADGAVLHGPAVKTLAPKTLPAKAPAE